MSLRRTELAPELAWLLEAAAGRSAPADRLDPGVVVALARHHRLAPHLDAVLAADLPPALRHPLHAARRRSRLRGLGQAAELARLSDGLARAGIAVMALKGPALAHLLWGDASRRDCRDLDLLVPPGQAGAALTWLADRGFAAETVWTGDHDIVLHRQRPRQIVELHVRLAGEPRLFALDAWGMATTISLAGTRLQTLALPAAVAYAAWHGSRHLWNRLGWLTDIQAALRHPGLDWREVLELAGALGIERHLALAAVLSRDLLQADLPPPLAARSRLLAEATRAAAVLAPAYGLPPVIDRDSIYRIGVLRTLRWQASLEPGLRAWLTLRHQFRVPDGDRRTFPLPAWAEPARPLLRLWRITRRAVGRR